MDLVAIKARRADCLQMCCVWGRGHKWMRNYLSVCLAWHPASTNVRNVLMGWNNYITIGLSVREICIASCWGGVGEELLMVHSCWVFWRRGINFNWQHRKKNLLLKCLYLNAHPVISKYLCLSFLVLWSVKHGSIVSYLEFMSFWAGIAWLGTLGSCIRQHSIAQLGRYRWNISSLLDPEAAWVWDLPKQ